MHGRSSLNVYPTLQWDGKFFRQQTVMVFAKQPRWTVPALGEGSGLGIVLERHALARG